MNKPLHRTEVGTQSSEGSLEVICKDIPNKIICKDYSNKITYPSNRLYGNDKRLSLERVKNIIKQMPPYLRIINKIRKRYFKIPELTGSRTLQMGLEVVPSYGMPLGFTTPTYSNNTSKPIELEVQYSLNPNQKRAVPRSFDFNKGELK